jgi:lysophospholipase L1-like esterase
MKTVLCYGDSNTWGYDPAKEDRFPPEQRWTGVLAQTLGQEYRVIEEGLNGRTTVWEDPIEGYKNGQAYLIPCLESHRPFDLITIMLGTNDLKKRFSLSAFDIAEGAGVLAGIALASAAGPGGKAPEVLLIAPPPVARLTGFAEMFEGSEPKSLRFPQHYQRVAQERGCRFFNAGDVIHSSDLDGIHFEAGEHRKLGQALAGAIREILG